MGPKRTLKPFDKSTPWGAEREKKKQKRLAEAAEPHHVEQVPTALFFSNNEQLGPPYYVIVDTNFLNACIKNKIELVDGMMNCLYAKCIPVILDSVMAELEKLGCALIIYIGSSMANAPRRQMGGKKTTGSNTAWRFAWPRIRAYCACLAW